VLAGDSAGRDRARRTSRVVLREQRRAVLLGWRGNSEPWWRNRRPVRRQPLSVSGVELGQRRVGSCSWLRNCGSDALGGGQGMTTPLRDGAVEPCSGWSGRPFVCIGVSTARRASRWVKSSPKPTAVQAVADEQETPVSQGCLRPPVGVDSRAQVSLSSARRVPQRGAGHEITDSGCTPYRTNTTRRKAHCRRHPSVHAFLDDHALPFQCSATDKVVFAVL